jgi:ABC-type nitrate/sulfonate/bicarbonate transport system permease component
MEQPLTPSRSRWTGRGLVWPLVSVVTVLFLLVIWWLLTTASGVVKPLFFPAPGEVVERAGVLGPTLVGDAVATFLRVLVSWSIGSALGIILGLAMVRSRAAYHVLTPLIEGLRPIPPVALVPFIILWFGIGDNGKLALGGLACFMVMVVNTVVSSRNVSPVYKQAARSLGATERAVYRTVILKAIVPELVSGLRIGAALAFAVIVAAEMIGAQSGLGRLIMLASRTLDTPVVLLGTIVIGLEAFILDRVIQAWSARVTRWAPREDS